MLRMMIVNFLLLLAACGSAPSSSLSSAPVQDLACMSELVRVTIDDKGIFWNGEPVDEPELARRAAHHWCRERPYAIVIDQAIPHPDDTARIARSQRVSRLIQTRRATLAETLQRLATGTY